MRRVRRRVASQASRRGSCCARWYAGAQRAEYTVFGDAINLSARLMCKAKGGMGTVLTDEPTQKWAKRAALFRKLTPLPVKGKAEKVQVFAVKPLPPVSVSDGRGEGGGGGSGGDAAGAKAHVVHSVNVKLRFVGRTNEMATVRETCNRVFPNNSATAAAAAVVEEEEEEDEANQNKRTSFASSTFLSSTARGGGKKVGAFIAFHGVVGVGKTRMLREAAAEAKRCGFSILELPAGSEGIGGGKNGAGLRHWRSVFVEVCRLLSGKTPVSVSPASLGKWTGAPKDLVKEIATAFGVNPSVVPPVVFDGGAVHEVLSEHPSKAGSRLEDISGESTAGQIFQCAPPRRRRE